MTKPAPNFDRVARIYRWSEYLALGTLLEHTREYFLPQLLDRRKALVLGDGDGRFLAKLLQQDANLQAVAMDTSAAMLKLLAKRCNVATSNDMTRLRINNSSALTVIPDKDTDLIVTHFFLDCLTQTELDGLTHQIASRVSHGTIWLVSDFALPHNPALKPVAALYIRALYLAFRILTGLRVTHLPDANSALQRAGFKRTARHERLFGFIYTEIWRRQ